MSTLTARQRNAWKKAESRPEPTEEEKAVYEIQVSKQMAEFQDKVIELIGQYVNVEQIDITNKLNSITVKFG